MNNYHTRLKLYKQALSDYRWARFPKLAEVFGRKSKGVTHSGLCLYFHSLGRGTDMDELPELMQFQPSQDVLDKHGDYWAPRGELEPRIKALKAAIKLTKQNMHL